MGLKKKKKESWVWPLDREDPLEEGMGAHSSILAWRIPWRKKPGRLWYIGLQKVGYEWSDLGGTRVLKNKKNRWIKLLTWETKSKTKHG